MTSSYAPAIIADMHRARMLAWDLPAEGWAIEVLSPDISFQRADCIDPQADRLFAPSTTCHYVRPLFASLFQYLKMRSIGWRALLPLYFAGRKLLASGRFDLVYFSTTQFVLFRLGLAWWKTFRVPYVLDFHDPWVRERSGEITTKHRVKLWMNQILARMMEKKTVGSAAGVVAVSPAYIEQLQTRYPDAPFSRRGAARAIPFPARQTDLVGSSNQPEFTSRRLVYVGAGGQIMVKAFSHIMELLALIRRDDRDLVEAFRIELYGTGEAGVLSSVASRFGLCHLVSENPGRISYSRSIELALAAAGLFVFGVDDPAYMPSKLFTYSLTGKPLLVCTRQDSQANSYFQTNPGLGDLIHFGGSSSSFENDRLTLTKFLVEAMKRRSVDRSELLRPFLSSAAARRHAELFDECSNPQST